MRSLLLGSALAALVAVSVPAAAHAGTFDFTITSDGTTATGVFNTTGNTVTSITDGYLDGTTPITLLGPGAYGGNDNFLSPTALYFNDLGVAFTNGTTDYNIYVYGGYLLCSSSETGCNVSGQGNSATVTVTPAISATPEPSSLVCSEPAFSSPPE